MICSLPCDRLPCSEPCLRLLPCGLHLCPGLCSENCLTKCDECTTGLFPDSHLIQLPCVHAFEVMALDAMLGLEDFYQVDSDGSIRSVRITGLPELNGIHCPDCSKPIRDVGRYDVVNQLKELPATIDYFYAKIGRKLSQIVGDVFHSDEYLSRTFGAFCKTLKPGPLGGKHNQRTVWDRVNHMLEAQQKATRFRDNVVMLFEDNMTRLAQFLDNADVLDQMVSPLKLRFDLVYYCCRLVTLEDGLRVYKLLTTLESADQHTSIIAEGLRLKILEQSCGEVKAMEARIADCKTSHLKRLEVELRIVQLCLHMILKSLDTISGLNVAASLARMRELCVTFPDTAGKMLGPYQKLRAYVEGGAAPKRFLDMYSKDSMALAPAYAKYQMGSLKYCKQKHPYCSANFKDCPECGREVPLPVKVDNSKFLQEDAFLAHFGIFRNRPT